MGLCLTCLRRGGRVVRAHARITTNAAVEIGAVLAGATAEAADAVTAAISETVTEVTAAAAAPPVEGVRRALLLSMRPMVVRALVAMPLATGTLYAAQVGIVRVSLLSARTTWVAALVQNAMPTVAMGVGCALLLAMAAAARPTPLPPRG